MTDPSPGPFDPAVIRFLAQVADRLPDLGASTVLVPHLHASAPFLAALRQQVPMPVFLPPRVTTLAALAATQPALGEPPDADALRLVQLRDVLARTGLLSEAGLWPAAGELLALLDELSHHLLTPPTDFRSFQQQCEAAYRRRLSRPLEREARLVYEIWRAMAQGPRPDRVAYYGTQLARAAASATGPLYTLGLTGLTPLEQGFLHQWARQQPVIELPEPQGLPGRRVCLAAAWEAQASDPPLVDRADGLRVALPDSPLREGVRLLAAGDLESLARSAARVIHDWVDQGLEAIGIVALDRLAARRLRALLERHGVLVRDETGWTFSTAAVSHVPDRLCALVADDAYYLDLLDLLKSPFVLADLDRDARLAAVADLEAAVHHAGTVQGLARFRDLAEQRAPAALPLLHRLGEALSLLAASRDTLAGWLGRLGQALDRLGCRPAMGADTAGAQLLGLLASLAADLAPHGGRHTFADWRGWLLRQMEEASFLDTGIDSPLRLTYLAGARLRDFQAVLVLGADAGRLPGRSPPGLFNDALRAELGLPGQSGRLAEQRRLLMDVLDQTPRVTIAWQASDGGDPQRPGPWLELLDALHRQAYGDSLVHVAPPLPLPAAGMGTPSPRPSLPAPPGVLTASGWQSLVACPYQFYARHGLGLRQRQELAEEMEKRDYGERVHAILRAFHEAHPRLGEVDRDLLLDRLAALSEQHFALSPASQSLARAWLARWRRQLPAYLDWALQWEAAGHAWQAAEVDRRRTLEWAADHHLTLAGRLDRVDRVDRVDRGPAGEVVLDYKTRDYRALKAKAKPDGEAVQLPFYALLTSATEAVYVALDDKKAVRAVAWEGDLAQAAGLESGRIAAAWQAMADGARLPAQGADASCQWCEMIGLCRRGTWDEATDASGLTPGDAPVTIPE